MSDVFSACFSFTWFDCSRLTARWNPRPDVLVSSQFSTPDYKIIRRNRNKNGGRIFFYIDEDISFSSDRQFLTHGYPIIRKDWNKNGRRIFFFIDEYISLSSNSQYSIRGYPIIRKGRNKNGGWIFFYIDEDIPFQVTDNFQYLLTT